MPVLKLPNNKILEVAVNNKCGITSAISIMCYPYFNKHLARRGSNELIKKGLFSKSLDRAGWVKSDYKVAIVRDPISRILSCYADRVLIKNRKNVKENVTDWDYFINNLQKIQEEYKDIWHHSYPQVNRLGRDPSIYDKIFNTKNLNNEFPKFIGELYNTKIPSIHTKSSGSIKNKINLTDKHLELIKEFYKEDYKYYGDYFDQ